MRCRISQGFRGLCQRLSSFTHRVHCQVKRLWRWRCQWGWLSVVCELSGTLRPWPLQPLSRIHSCQHVHITNKILTHRHRWQKSLLILKHHVNVCYHYCIVLLISSSFSWWCVQGTHHSPDHCSSASNNSEWQLRTQPNLNFLFLVDPSSWMFWISLRYLQ